LDVDLLLVDNGLELKEDDDDDIEDKAQLPKVNGKILNSTHLF